MNQQLAEIYNELKQQDAALSQRRFSKDYLGRSEAYLFCNNYYGRDISKSAAVTLYNNLKSMSDTWALLYEETQTERYRTNHAVYESLAAKAQRIVFAA